MLEGIPGLAGFAIRDDALTITADPAEASAINRSLVAAGIAVSELRSERASLEDVFLDLTREEESDIMRSLAAELLVLRKRASTWILLGVWVVLGLLFAYLLPYLTYKGGAGGLQPTPLELMLPHRLADNLLGGFPFFGGVLALMVGVLAVGSDYGWDTLKTLLIQRPGRMRVFGAKVAALAVALVPFVVASFLAGAVASFLVAGAENAAVHWPSALELVRGVAAGWFILATWATFGVLLAVLSRGTALAIGLGIVYALVVEGLLSALAEPGRLARCASSSTS